MFSRNGLRLRGDVHAFVSSQNGYDVTQQISKTVHVDANDPVVELTTYTYNLQGRMASADVSAYDSTGATLQSHSRSVYEYDAGGPDDFPHPVLHFS